jgi:energy-coupling factor transporter ATP-binding protein EcfA2
MITSVTLQNFKGHAHTVVPLQQFTVLVGPNGSGKTSVLQAIRYMGQLAAGVGTDTLFQGDRELPRLLRDPAGDQLLWSLAGVEGEEPFSMDVAYQHVNDPALFTQGQRPALGLVWSFRGHSIGQGTGRDFGAQVARIAPEQLHGVMHGWRTSLSTASLFSFDPSIIAAPASSQEPLPRIEFDGRNTAVALKAMKLGYDEAWDRMRAVLRKIVPNVVSVGVEQVKDVVPEQYPSASQLTAPPPSGEWYRLFFDFKGAKHVPAYHASEGTLLTVALLAVLLGPAAPKLILLDDIEQTLHPAAQLELVRQLRELLAMEEMRDVQVIATTHSPYILQQLDPGQVQVFALRPDGSVATKCLADHPDAAELRGVESAADLWTNDPEASWVVGPEAPAT